MTKRWAWPKSGTCRVCGCTEFNACDGGCWWVDLEQTLCSTCSGTADDLAYVLRWIEKLRGRYGRAADILKAATRLIRDALGRLRARQQAQP